MTLDVVFMSDESPPPYSAVAATPLVEYVLAPGLPILVVTQQSIDHPNFPTQRYRSVNLTASSSISSRSSPRGKHSTRVSRMFATLHPRAPSSNSKKLRSPYARFVLLSARHISPFEIDNIYRDSRHLFGSPGTSQVLCL